jgi:hypothetical protein
MKVRSHHAGAIPVGVCEAFIIDVIFHVFIDQLVRFWCCHTGLYIDVKIERGLFRRVASRVRDISVADNLYIF